MTALEPLCTRLLDNERLLVALRQLTNLVNVNQAVLAANNQHDGSSMTEPKSSRRTPTLQGRLEANGEVIARDTLFPTVHRPWWS